MAETKIQCKSSAVAIWIVAARGGKGREGEEEGGMQAGVFGEGKKEMEAELSLGVPVSVSP